MHASHLLCSNIGYLVEAKQARGAIWLGTILGQLWGRPVLKPPQPQITTLQSFFVLLTASFFLFTIISTGDENKIFQLIVALFACLLLILMEMMVIVLVMVRIKGIGW